MSSLIALVTGGASGIGFLVARSLAERGARVVIWDINPEAIERALTEGVSAGLTLNGMACDVSDRLAVYRAADEVRARFGDVDILVNNAGIVSGSTFLETPDEKAIRTMEINVMSNFWTVKAFLPRMLERNAGHLVTISSAAGIIGVTGLADYSASKFAAFGFHEAIRMEIRKKKSRVASTVVCPFFIDTGMFKGVKTRFPFLLPILKPEYAAGRIIRAIERRSRRVIMPRFVYSAYLLRLLPVRFLDLLADFFGISTAMDHFTGREKP